jgi:hypothetical protein
MSQPRGRRNAVVEKCTEMKINGFHFSITPALDTFTAPIGGAPTPTSQTLSMICIICEKLDEYNFCI